jgi:hypothetical protein
VLELLFGLVALSILKLPIRITLRQRGQIAEVVDKKRRLGKIMSLRERRKERLFVSATLCIPLLQKQFIESMNSHP